MQTPEDIDSMLTEQLSLLAAKLKQAYGSVTKVPTGQVLLSALLGTVAGAALARRVLIQTMDFSHPTFGGALKSCHHYQPQSLDLIYLKARLPSPYGLHANLFIYHLDQLANLERKLSQVMEVAMANIDGPSAPAAPHNQFHL